MRFARFMTLAVLSVAIVAGCSTPAPAGPISRRRRSHRRRVAPHRLSRAARPDRRTRTWSTISALNIKFEQTTVTAPAGTPFQVQFENKDAGAPHNVALRLGDVNGAELFKGEVFNGIATRVYDVPALDAGAYAFVCTVHPTMVGTLNAE